MRADGKQREQTCRFIRVAEQRTQKVLDDLRVLGKCAHPACYEYSSEDIEKIFDAIERAVQDARDTLEGKKRFVLSDTTAKE